MQIYFLRHGETDYNASARMQGQVDIPLNEKGLMQARMAKRYFDEHQIRFDRVISSPLIRAVRTAEIVSGRTKDQIEIDDRLIELGFGVAEGRNFHEIPDGWRNFIKNPPAYELPEGAEPLDHLFERCKAFLVHLVSDAENGDADKTVFAATHGAAIRGVIKVIEGRSLADYWFRGLENCGGILVRIDQGRCTIEEYIHTLPENAHMHGWQN